MRLLLMVTSTVAVFWALTNCIICLVFLSSIYWWCSVSSVVRAIITNNVDIFWLRHRSVLLLESQTEGIQKSPFRNVYTLSRACLLLLNRLPDINASFGEFFPTSFWNTTLRGKLRLIVYQVMLNLLSIFHFALIL